MDGVVIEPAGGLPVRQLREFVERYSVEPEVERLIVAFHAGESSSKDLSYAKRTLDLGVALIPVLYRDRATKQKA